MNLNFLSHEFCKCIYVNNTISFYKMIYCFYYKLILLLKNIFYKKNGYIYYKNPFIEKPQILLILFLISIFVYSFNMIVHMFLNIS